MRTYEETHPWITMTLDVNRAQPGLWILLGEAQSKSEHLAGVPLEPQVADEFYKVTLAKGVLATTAIEGNTLTEEEVRARVDGRRDLPPSREYLGREVDNILDAVNKIGAAVLAGRRDHLSVDDIREYNRLVLKDLSLEEQVVPGQIRRYSVGVGTYRAAPAEDCEYLLSKLCDWLNSDWLDRYAHLRDYSIAFGILKAIIAHLYIAWIHPFGDGNGRTARLIEFQILLAAGIPSIAAHLLSNHYNNTRTEYYRQLTLSSRKQDGPLAFVHYALRGFVDSLREQIETVKAQQLIVHWRDHIYRTIRGDTPTFERRRHLAIDLPISHSVAIDDIATLSTRLAREYSQRTSKTIRRDLNYLQNRNLVTVTNQTVETNRNALRAFLPLVRPAGSTEESRS